MAKTDDDVMALVEDELKRNPGASVDDLFERARGVSPAVGKLSRRQFNARYPLQVKRRSGAGAAQPKRRGRPRKDATAANAGDAAAAAPKRRGRPRKNPETAPVEAAAAPRRRGRPRKNPVATPPAAAAAPKRRGRPRKDAKAAPAAAPSGLQALLPKRRGRPPRSAQAGAGTGGGGGTGTGGTPNREGVRQVFMRFANEIAGGGPKEIMRALSNLDRFVDDAIRQATR